MDAEKPTIIFTTFWDAIRIKESKGFLFENKVVQFEDNEIQVLSIALVTPPNLKLKNIPTLDLFCPSWDILKKYKKDKDWDSYTQSYTDMLSERKAKIVSWLNSLSSNLYVLSCWENTINGANCHRKIVFDLLAGSKKVGKYANFIYRHGDKKENFVEQKFIETLNYIES